MHNITDKWISTELTLFPDTINPKFECSLLSLQNLKARTLKFLNSVPVTTIFANNIYFKCLILVYKPSIGTICTFDNNLIMHIAHFREYFANILNILMRLVYRWQKWTHACCVGIYAQIQLILRFWYLLL